MKVFILVREDQNQHGFVDTSISGVFRDRKSVEAQESVARLRARAEGFLVEDDDCPDGEWQVSWKVEEHFVNEEVP